MNFDLHPWTPWGTSIQVGRRKCLHIYIYIYIYMLVVLHSGRKELIRVDIFVDMYVFRHKGFHHWG